MEDIDLRELDQAFLLVLMVRKWVVRIGDTNFGVGTIARFASELESDDTRCISLHREELQIKHQSRVICERGGNA